MTIPNYKKLSFIEYIKHKGNPDYEIAFNKKMLDLIERDPTGGYKEKRIKNIKYWEGMKNAERENREMYKQQL